MGKNKNNSKVLSKKNTALVIVVIIILATIAAISIRSLSGEDDWMCQNGKWVRHGHPSSAKPIGKCGQAVSENDASSDSTHDSAPVQGDKNDNSSDAADIQIEKPKSGDTASSPLEIDGRAKGSWFFEGQFPIKLIDGNGLVLATGQAKALGDWANEDTVPFRAILEFSVPASASATLVFSQDDPSGQSNAEEIKVPVAIGKAAGMKIKVFFLNIQFDPDASDCSKVYEVERVIPKTQATARAAMIELLSGPTELEKSGGFSTNINSDVTVQKISITNGVANIDFSQKMGEGVSGDCRTTAIKAQIIETLKQFPAVKDAVISIDGNKDGILQP